MKSGHNFNELLKNSNCCSKNWAIGAVFGFKERPVHGQGPADFHGLLASVDEVLVDGDGAKQLFSISG